MNCPDLTKATRISSGRCVTHPRAGGGHLLNPRLKGSGAGSSPRGRGTRGGIRADAPGRRFIPARAGNTANPHTPGLPPSVHPRAGGEHAEEYEQTRPGAGSSPRGRGTRQTPIRLVYPHRFIPARAGNTRSPSVMRTPPPVHPRAGGEHNAAGNERVFFSGSSPRGRGTPDPQAVAVPAVRFIPARAGNTKPGSPRRPNTAVHPRAGGEHSSCNMMIQKAFSNDGSSTKLSISGRRMAQVSGTAP